MKEQEYLEEIEHLIKKNEISKKVRRLEENHSLVETYWQIGRLIVEAQGGSTRAKYGNELIKKWSVKLTETYGKGYNYMNLSRFRQFYLCYPILAPSGQYYWTMSPCWYNGGSARVFIVWSSGSLGNWHRVNSTDGVRPVINIRSDIELTGTGSQDNPFKVVGAS